MHTIEQVALVGWQPNEPSARPPIGEARGRSPVQSCLFGHCRAEVVYDCP